MDRFAYTSKGQSSRSPIIGPVNKSFETPAVNQFFLNAVSVFCQNLYLSSRFNPKILFGGPLITGGIAYNFVFSNCIINKGVWLIKLCIVHVNQKLCAMHCC